MPTGLAAGGRRPRQGPASAWALRTSSGCTHTTGILAARVVTTSGFHRCPVGSHASTSPANPAPAATGSDQARISLMHHADPENIRRASTTES